MVLWHQLYFTLVPEVFLKFSPHERAASVPRSSKHESPSEEETPLVKLVTLDLNLTLMQTGAVKRINSIIQKRVSGNLAIMCLSAANVSTWVVKSGIFSDLLGRGQCACLWEWFHPQRSRRFCLLNILQSKYLHFHFVTRPWDFRIERYKLLWVHLDGARRHLRWNATVLQFVNMRAHKNLEYTTKIMTRWGYLPTLGINQIITNWLSTSCSQNGKHIFVIYNSEQGFDVRWDFQSLENAPWLQRSNSFEGTVRNKINVKHRRILNVHINWELQYFANKFFPW